jgi:hypothetical protein
MGSDGVCTSICGAVSRIEALIRVVIVLIAISHCPDMAFMYLLADMFSIDNIDMAMFPVDPSSGNHGVLLNIEVLRGAPVSHVTFLCSLQYSVRQMYCSSMLFLSRPLETMATGL